MEHRGVEYRILQGIKSGDWKWSVLLETVEKNSGQAVRRDDAVTAAKRAIDLRLPRKGSHQARQGAMNRSER